MSEDVTPYGPPGIEGGVEVIVDGIEAFDTALASPDPDPEALATLAPPGWAPSNPAMASRILRATVRQQATVGKLKQAMAADAEAWTYLIAAQESREAALRRMLEAYLVATGESIGTPWGTAYMAKGRKTVVVDDEAACLAVLKRLGANDAWKTKESIVKKEFDVIFNSKPKDFGEIKGDAGKTHPRIAHEETGQASVVIRK